MLSCLAAACAAASCQGPVVGSCRRATRRAAGSAALMSSRHLPVRLGWSRNNPVTFPPGRARLRAKGVERLCPAFWITVAEVSDSGSRFRGELRVGHERSDEKAASERLEEHAPRA